MRAVADENIARLAETFGQRLELSLVPGRTLSRSQLGSAEVLLVRSVTRVDEALLAGSSVRFVGTATIGTDHLDTDWLDRQGIRWASAPGCNADAAAQYTLGMVMLACRRLDRELREQRVGIVGHGNVGSRLHRLLDTLGVSVVVCDPPLDAAGLLESRPLEEALACDIVSLHVPLTHDGPWATAGMINADTLSALRKGALLVNASRGGVIEEAPLRWALDEGRLHVALDVWPREPDIDPALLDAVTVATPHVAGYSVQGKERGTEMIFNAFLVWRGAVPPPGLGDDAAASWTLPGIPAVEVDEGSADPVGDAVIAATGVALDDHRMRAPDTLDTATFDALRRAHAPRHEFSRLRVRAPLDARPVLAALGFRVSQDASHS